VEVLHLRGFLLANVGRIDDDERVLLRVSAHLYPVERLPDEMDGRLVKMGEKTFQESFDLLVRCERKCGIIHGVVFLSVIEPLLCNGGQQGKTDAFVFSEGERWRAEVVSGM